MKQKRLQLKDFLISAFAVCILFFGMYYEFCGAILTVVLTVFVCIYQHKTHRLHFRATVGMVLYLLMLFCYTISIVYGMDSGMAFLGLGKILWIAPFLLLYQQLAPDEKGSVLAAIPWFGCAATLIGLVGVWIPALKEQLWVNGRLGGFFQYPNTMAVFLLTGLILLLYARGQTWRNLFCYTVLCGGIAATGSRTVLVLAVFFALIIIIGKKKYKFLLLSFAIAVALGGYIVITGDTATIGRILKISATESTFVGRFLYAQDALPLLLRHPFGMGYLGYYYMENQVQTGVYTVRYVHNDLLQIGLDIGWIPMVVYLCSILAGIFGKHLPGEKKLILTTVFLHGLFDFDLAYTVMLCLMLMILDDVPLPWKNYTSPEPSERMSAGARLIIICALLILLGSYIAIPTLAAYCEKNELAASVFPWNTEADLVLLSEEEDIRTVEKLADKILKQNETCALAYYAKAVVAYYGDDYKNVILFQKEAIARDYYNYEEYYNYASMLCDGLIYAEDDETMELCREELSQIANLMEDAKEKESALGKRINDQPNLEVDAELSALLSMAE